MVEEPARAKARSRRTTEKWRHVEAEEITGTALMALPPGWTVLHDLAWPSHPRAAVDHVVVGPAGVFVIDTKSWSGRIEVDHGLLRQDGRDRSTAVWGAASAAASVAALVPSLRADHVHAVVCLAEGDVRIAWLDGVLVCSSTQLVEELTSYAEVLPGGLARAIAADVRRRLQPAAPPAAVTSASRRRPLARLVPAVLAAAVVVAVLTQPEMLSSLVDGVAGWWPTG